MDFLEMARLYEKEIGRYGGAVVIFEGVVSGWMDELRSASRWEPGCIAVYDGEQFKSVGGDSYNGAEKWELIRD